MRHEEIDIDVAFSPICMCCGDECEPTMIDEGIGPYEFWGFKGTHHDWKVASNCCGENIGDGRVIANHITYRRATKDLYNASGKLKVRKGYPYFEHFRKSWARDEDGNSEGFFILERREISEEKMGMERIKKNTRGVLIKEKIIRDGEETAHEWYCLSAGFHIPPEMVVRAATDNDTLNYIVNEWRNHLKRLDISNPETIFLKEAA